MSSKTHFLSSLKTCKIRLKWNLKFSSLACRKYSIINTHAPVVQEEHIEALPDPGIDKYKSDRDVPFLLLPHTVKKAHHVHETSCTLPKIFDKYKWVTKTISSAGLPVQYDMNVVSNELESEQVKGFHESLRQTVAYSKRHKYKDNPWHIPDRISYSMINNFLRISMMRGDDAEHLRPENSYLYYQPLLETHWPRNYDFYRTKFRPQFVLHTRGGFDAIEETTELTPDELEQIPGPYTTHSMNTYRQSIIHLRNRPCMDNAKFNPIKHCHTTIAHNNRVRTVEQLLSLGKMTMFSQLAAQAQAAGVLHGTELKNPLVTQCIATNGHLIVFMVYQLNTMYLMDDKGLWNRCWYSPVMEMYERKTDRKSINYLYEEAETGTELPGFREDWAKLFVNFIRKPTV